MSITARMRYRNPKIRQPMCRFDWRKNRPTGSHRMTDGVAGSNCNCVSPAVCSPEAPNDGEDTGDE